MEPVQNENRRFNMAFRTEYSLQMHPAAKAFKHLSAITTNIIDRT